MKRIVVTLLGLAFAMTAGAQAPASQPLTKQDKQQIVKVATEDAQKQQAVKAAEGCAAAVKTKDMPKSLPDNKAKQQAVKSTCEEAQKQLAVKAAEGSAAAAASKGTPKVLPDNKAKQQAVKSTTEAAEKQAAVASAEGSARIKAEQAARTSAPKPAAP